MLRNFSSVSMTLLVLCGHMGLSIVVVAVLLPALQETLLRGMVTRSESCQYLIQCTFSSLVRPAVAIGAGVGGLVAGLLIGLAVTFLLISRYYKKKMHADRFVDLPGSPNAKDLSHDFHYRAIPTTSTSGVSHPTHTSAPSGDLHRLRSQHYHVEPFVMPDENGRLADEARSTGHTATTPPETVSSAAAAAPQQLYVLHHDSNIPPVTIYHETGTEVVELPPRYPRNASQTDVVSEGQSRTDTRSDGSRTESSQRLAIHEPRQPTQVGKPARLL